VKTPRRTPPRRVSRIERTAYHEAGHAVAAYVRHLRFTSISIIPDRGTLGRCEFSETGVVIDPESGTQLRARRRIETLIIVSLAGVIAESLLTGRHNWRGAHADLHDATRYASFVTGNVEELRAYERWLWEHTRTLLGARPCWLAVQQLAVTLIEDRRIGERRARAIIGAAIERGTVPRRAKRTSRVRR
jgi:hypothetical protein